jgi:hypothetical protein
MARGSTERRGEGGPEKCNQPRAPDHRAPVGENFARPPFEYLTNACISFAGSGKP